MAVLIVAFFQGRVDNVFADFTSAIFARRLHLYRDNGKQRNILFAFTSHHLLKFVCYATFPLYAALCGICLFSYSNPTSVSIEMQPTSRLVPLFSHFVFWFFKSLPRFAGTPTKNKQITGEKLL